MKQQWVIWVGVGLLACGEENVGRQDAVRAGNDPNGAAEPSFWQDVAPILEDKCTACHQTGGIAPFALEGFEDAESRAGLIADLTENRIMPPYLMDVGGECGSFDESQALTDAEIAIIGAWARGERLAGAPGAIAPPAPPSLAEGTDLFTPLFTPEIEGGVLAQFDEYRCFALETGLTEDAFVTAFEVTPGNPAVVHHAVLMLVDPAAPSGLDGMNNEQAIERLRQQDPNPGRDGWQCFSGAGEGVREEGSPGGWAPGTGAYRFPEGIGVRLRPDRQLVVQLHFNLARPEVRGQSDETRVRLQLEDSVERQATFLLHDAFLGSLGNDPPDMLEPGNPRARYAWTSSAGAMGVPPGVPIEVLNVVPHMHERGRKYRLEFGRDGAFECQGNIERWDFNWQRIYSYLQPPALDSDSAVRVSCEYDTSADASPVLPGWGTRNEMCELTLGVVFPAGVTF